MVAPRAPLFVLSGLPMDPGAPGEPADGLAGITVTKTVLVDVDRIVVVGPLPEPAPLFVLSGVEGRVAVTVCSKSD